MLVNQHKRTMRTSTPPKAMAKVGYGFAKRAFKLGKKVGKGYFKGKYSERQVRGFGERIFKEAAAKYGTGVAADLLARMAKPFGVQVGRLYSKAISTPSDFTGDDHVVPSFTVSSSRMVSGANHLTNYTRHVTNFTAGKRPSKTVYKAFKQWGGTSLKMFDTREDYPVEGADANRSRLVLKTGFNRKLQAMHLTGFHWNFSDADQAFDFNFINSPNLDQQRAYIMTMNLTVDLQFTNINKFLPVHAKIYMLKCHAPSYNANNHMTRACNPLWGTYSQEPQAMPVANQYSDFVASGSMQTVDVDPRSNGVFSSEHFKSAYEVVGVFKKKLNAGDIWDFKYKHQTGPGLRWDKLKGAFSDGGGSYALASPITYIPLIELKGVRVEGYRADNADRRVIGTGPVAVQVEADKRVYGVQRPASIESNDPLHGGFKDNRFAIRLFNKAVTNSNALLPSRLFNTSFSDVVGGPGSSTQIIVPIMSDTTEQNSGERT